MDYLNKFRLGCILSLIQNGTKKYDDENFYIEEIIEKIKSIDDYNDGCKTRVIQLLNKYNKKLQNSPNTVIEIEKITVEESKDLLKCFSLVLAGDTVFQIGLQILSNFQFVVKYCLIKI